MKVLRIPVHMTVDVPLDNGETGVMVVTNKEKKEYLLLPMTVWDHIAPAFLIEVEEPRPMKPVERPLTAAEIRERLLENAIADDAEPVLSPTPRPKPNYPPAPSRVDTEGD
jgi:hypothetical protein